MASTSGVVSFAVGSSEMAVLEGSQIVLTGLDGTPVLSIPVPSMTYPSSQSSLVLGPDGSTYITGVSSLDGNSWVVEAFSPTGASEWKYAVPGNSDGIYGWTDGAGVFEVGVVLRGHELGELLDPLTGAVSGSGPVPAGSTTSMVSAAASNGLLDAAGGYVTQYASNGQATFRFGGSPASPAPGSALPFNPAGSFEIDGDIFVANPGNSSAGGGIDEFDATTGQFLGWASNDYLNLTQDPGLAYTNGEVYLANGGMWTSTQNVSKISLADLQTLVQQPKQPVGGLGQTLGVGAGLYTSATANYFSSGSMASVTATFDPWWAVDFGSLTFEYRIGSPTEVTEDSWPAYNSIPMSSLSEATTGAYSGMYTLPLALPAADTQPGVYEVDARLVTPAGAVFGSTCLSYSVGAPGDRLDFSNLAGGPDYGGSLGIRDVQLASQLGSNLSRVPLQWSMLLPSCQSSSPTASSCGPDAIQYSVYDAEIAGAASEASQLGIDFEVMISDGDPTAKTLVMNGFWQADVEALVSHLRSAAPSLRYFEIWNEPNATWGPAPSYVTSIEQPAYAGIKAGNPDAQVVGGTAVGTSIGWWDQFAAAGGFDSLDVVGFHPYPAYDRSFEEEGTVSFIEALKALAVASGAGEKPLWVTEMGQWSNDEASFYPVGNWVAREVTLLRSLGINDWAYFIREGGFSDSLPAGLQSYSLIQAAGTDEYVKPAGLELMTADNELSGRAFVKSISTGTPLVQAYEFGPSPTDPGDLVVLWSDDLTTNTNLSFGQAASGPVDDAFGGSQSVNFAVAGAELSVTGSPEYIHVPAGADPSFQPTEDFGTDVASAPAGATATASSFQSSNSAAMAIAGTADAEGGSGIGSDAAWISQPMTSDPTPTLTVSFGQSRTIDRVIVVGPSHTSVVPGLRHIQVQVQTSGGWDTVGDDNNLFFNGSSIVSFSPVTVSAVRVVVLALNFGGTPGGLYPYFWSAGFPDYAEIYAVQAYEPGTIHSLSSGNGVQPPPTTVPGSPGSGGGSGGASGPPPTSTTTTGPPTSTSSPTTTPPGNSPTGQGGSGTSNPQSRPAVTPVDSHPRPANAGPIVATGSVRASSGTLLTTATGAVYTANGAGWHGDLSGVVLNKAIVGMAMTPSGKGYWLVASDGGVFAFGDAAFYGSTGNVHLNQPIVGMTATSDGRGYWLVASDGGVFSFGDARFYGSTGAIHLDQPVVGMAASGNGRGYWLVARDGGIFAFGDASFHGSTGGIRLAQPIVTMAPSPAGGGYWMLASDGGVFAFGTSRFYGSPSGTPGFGSAVGMTITADGGGYVIYGSGGAVGRFGAT